MSNLQTTFLFLAAGMVLFWLILAATGPRKTAQPGAIAVLRYGAVFRTLALIIALVPPTLLGYLAVAVRWPSSTHLAIAGGCFLATSLLVGLLYLEVAGAQIVLMEDGIKRASPWTGPLTLQWTEIQRVQYSPLNRWFVLKSSAGTIRVSRHLAGITAFGLALQQKVPPERWTQAAASILGKKPIGHDSRIDS